MWAKAKKNKTKYVFLIVAFLLNLNVGSFLAASFASALSYQQDVGVSFTFNSTIGVSLSSADIYIYNLAPGTVSDSNIVTVNILTNTTNGYTLNASVGNNSTFASAERNLVHSNSNFNNLFSSIDFGSSLAANTDLTENTWGYSYSNDDGTTWSNYSGLPLYSDTTNIATLKTSTEPVASTTGDKVKFKIAAKASSTQPSGEYNNVINFTLVATPIPMTLEMAYADAGKERYLGYYKLQDMNASICNTAEVLDEGSQMQAIDIRDNKVYWITKLQDGKCWMTQNLDLDLDSTRTYTHADTDLGWGSDTATMSWTPVRSTIDASDVTNNSIPDWSNSITTPFSVNPGNVYWNNSPYYASVINLFLKNDFGSNPVKFRKDTPFDSNGTHGHVGNYYNWSAAVAMNNTSGYTTSTYGDISANPQNSICPAGWRLPTISSQGDVANSTSEFARLNGLYNSSYASGEADKNLTSAPLYFVRSGNILNLQQSNSGAGGSYWSSTVFNSMYAYFLYFYNPSVNVLSHNNSKDNGRPIRCIAR